MVTVLKLGGSVITHKDDPETVDDDALETAVDAIAAFLDGHEESLVVVHGGGSFGHHHAATHGVSSTEGTTDASAILDIHQAMGELNEIVVSRLQAAGVQALPVRPLSVAHREPTLQFPSDQIGAMLGEGFVPVSHGDVVVHEGEGATILSGDDIVTSLARELSADRVGLCSTVPGVLDADGAVIPEIERYDAVESVLGESDATDVTGGMAGKVRTLLELESPAAIFSLDALETFLATGTAGTTVR